MKSILIADDEYDIALALELLLSSEGFHVVSVGNGKEALDYLTHSQPDLVILDVMMPVMTGLEVIQAIQSNSAHQVLPIILMSAAPTKATQDEYRWSAFISKPFNVDDFLVLVERLIGKAQA